MVSVVVLFAGESEDDEPATRSFFDEMRRLGWVEGTNITYERLEGRGEREYVEGLARSAASRIPDLIYATTTSTALAVVKETASIPVLFTSAADPVAAGLVASLVAPRRPSDRMTAFGRKRPLAEPSSNPVYHFR